MIESSTEVFMDDFFVFGYDFDTYLAHLNVFLERCTETNFVSKLIKCHFMVTWDIVLGHKISSKGIKVDQAKI